MTLLLPDTTCSESWPQSQAQLSHSLSHDPTPPEPPIQSITQAIDLVANLSGSLPPPQPGYLQVPPSTGIFTETTNEKTTNNRNNSFQPSQSNPAKRRFPRPENDSEEDGRPSKKKAATTLGDAIGLLSEKKYDFLTRQLEQQGMLRERELQLERERLQLEIAKAKREERQLELQSLQFQTMMGNLSRTIPTISQRYPTPNTERNERQNNPTTQPINHPTNQSTSQPANQSTSHSPNQSLFQCANIREDE